MLVKICPMTKRIIDANHSQVKDCAIDCPFFDQNSGKCPVNINEIEWIDNDN